MYTAAWKNHEVDENKSNAIESPDQLKRLEMVHEDRESVQ
jgi:hypothetical protein